MTLVYCFLYNEAASSKYKNEYVFNVKYSVWTFRAGN